MITVFDKKDLSVDYKTSRKVARYLKEQKLCDSIIVAGTTGEFYVLSFEERVKLFKEVKQELGDEIPLIAGVGSIYFEEVIRFTKVAEELGYNAIMVVAPYYCKPEQDGIYEHFKRVAESTSLPVMVYNIPLFTGVNIEPETLGKLSKIKNIFSVKDEAGLNPTQATEYLKSTSNKVFVYSGDDTMVLQVLLQCGVGVVSGGSHIIGDMMREMIEVFLQGQNNKAKEIYHKLYNVFRAFRGLKNRTNPIPMVKAALELVTGLPVSMPRLPLTAASNDEIQMMKKVLQKLGKL